MYGVLLAIHVIVAICLIGFILIQQGKGAQAGAAFGSGASQTVFGSQGSGNFLSKVTTYLAVVFFILNLVLAYVVNRTIKEQSVPVMPATTATVPATGSQQSAPAQAGNTSDIPSDVPSPE
ncbi:MAG: preprotein translocase subunit SecG [Candidatus Berkiella sp.]